MARLWRIRQSKEKDDNLEKALRKIELLDKQLQELPVLPSKESKFKLLTNKVKNKVSQVKTMTREKIQCHILQRNK